jgi:acetyltransferase-like isoleucine patch superfamily enzyme
MKAWLLRQLPPAWKHVARARLNAWQRDRKAPRMLRGYTDATGQWRPWVRMSDTVLIQCPERVVLEDLCFVWHYSILDGTGGLEIGEGSHIGAWVGIFTHSSHLALRIHGRHYLEVPEENRVGFRTAPVRIGRFVGIGASSLIMPGVTIGDGAGIMAGSIVQSNVAPFALVGGNPARVLGDMRRFDRRMLREHPELLPWYEEWQRVNGESSAGTDATADSDPGHAPAPDA